MSLFKTKNVGVSLLAAEDRQSFASRCEFTRRRSESADAAEHDVAAGRFSAKIEVSALDGEALNALDGLPAPDVFERSHPGVAPATDPRSFPTTKLLGIFD
jgi:hypothetical protein